MNYSAIAFTQAVKEMQEKYGSRASYARMEAQQLTGVLGQKEMDFIANQDNFYMATISETGFPYIQFRGGPKGFLKILDSETLAFLDFRGNKQYISTGNLITNNKLSLFLLDQAAKTRLKMFAHGSILSIEENPDLLQHLELDNYAYAPERIIILKIMGFDWNCPQHITGRYTIEQMRKGFEAQEQYIKQLQMEIVTLKAQSSS